jgi:hypothetical protein
MKMKIRPEDASMHQMNDWLAELREGDWEDRPHDGHAASARDDLRPPAPPEPPVRTAPPEPPVRPAPPVRTAPPSRPPAPPALPTWRVAAAAPPVPAEAAARPDAEAHRDAEAHFGAEAHPDAQAHFWPEAHSGPEAPPEPAAQTGPEALAGPTVRALIGDQLRMPIMWCEMGSCISSLADPAALGEADMRVRAIAAGWRIDAFGRLACPRCQQNDPGFRVSSAVVPWDRYTAMARAARIVAERPASLRRPSGEPARIDGGIDDPGIRRGPRPGPVAAGRRPRPLPQPRRDRPDGQGSVRGTAGGQDRRRLADAGRGDGRPDDRRLATRTGSRLTGSRRAASRLARSRRPASRVARSRLTGSRLARSRRAAARPASIGQPAPGRHPHAQR